MALAMRDRQNQPCRTDFHRFGTRPQLETREARSVHRVELAEIKPLASFAQLLHRLPKDEVMRTLFAPLKGCPADVIADAGGVFEEQHRGQSLTFVMG